jgi:hypothetical protein
MRNKKINWVLAASAFVMLTTGMGTMARDGGGRMVEMRVKSMDPIPVMESSMATEKGNMAANMEVTPVEA